jgi:hypothetical protein
MFRCNRCCARSFFGLLALVVMIPSTASAQYNYYSSGSFYFNQNNYPDVTAATFRAQEQNKQTNTEPKTTLNRASKTARSNDRSKMNNALPYIRSSAVSNSIRSEFLVDLGKRGAVKDVTQMRKMIEGNDFVQIFAGLARLQGLDSGTPEGLTALFYGQTWAIANQRPLPSASQYQGIAKQLRDTNANAMVWDKLNNQERQELVERLVYPLIIQRANYQIYLQEGRTAAIVDMSDRVQQGMKDFNMDMRKMQLSNSGFRNR